MDNQPFEKLAEQAASGLKSDPELYLDVKQELRSHLEDKAEFFAGEGKSEEESVELSCKSLGSPMDMAAELLNGNKQRMKLRSLMRLFLGGLIVPVAIILAFGFGFWRYARTSDALDVPTLLGFPVFFGSEKIGDENQNLLAYKLRGGIENAPQIRKYWETHRSDPDSRMYYAYYAIFLDPKNDSSFVGAMCLGEKLEPKNALYNVLLAHYYLKRGLQSRSADTPVKSNEVATDKILDRGAFEQGITELQKAADKPYLHTYQMQILRKKLNSLPDPVLTEDYISYISITTAEMFPELATFRDTARRIPSAVRLLIADGRRSDAAKLMDTWQPYVRLLSSESSPVLIHCLVTQSVGQILSKAAVPIYKELGQSSKASEAWDTGLRLARFKQEWRRENESSSNRTYSLLKQHGSRLVSIFTPIFGDAKLAESELKPGRMHEHVMMEEGVTLGTLAVLALLLIGNLVQSILWLYKLRQAASVPILLLPPTMMMLRALVFGIVIPIVFYWFYTRMLPIGGRDYGLASVMLPRFIVEMFTIALLVLYIPALLIRRYIRLRCADLGIPLPSKREEIVTAWTLRALMALAIVLVAVVNFHSTDVPEPILINPLYVIMAVFLIRRFSKKQNDHIVYYAIMLILLVVEVWYFQISISSILGALGILLAFAVTFFAIKHFIKKRGENGLYYGTLAKSLIPIYALSIILISSLQPLLMYSEVSWLKKDKLVYGYLADRHNATAGLTGVEQQATQKYWTLLKQALSDEPANSKHQ